MAGQFDVAVIGTGPAGSTAARHCAKLGLKTVLIDKCSISRPKPCGGGVSLKALKLIGQPIPESVIDQQVLGFRFYSKALKTVDLISQSPVGISTTRERFDAFLVKLATDEGCSLIQLNEIVDITVNKEKTVCKLKNKQEIEAKIIVGADGANSTVAKKTGIRSKWTNTEVGLCLETAIPLKQADITKIEPNIFELYFIDIPLGYGWVFPKKNAVSVGIGGSLATIHKPQEILADFCSTVSKLKNIDLNFSEFQAHLTPAGGFNRKIVTDRVMLTGDAAGFIDPFTGEGIYYAIRSGQLAAEACMQCISKCQFDEKSLEKNYSNACMKDFGKDLKVALNVSHQIHNHFDSFFDALQHSSHSSWADLASGEITYSTLQKRLLPKLLTRYVKRKIVKSVRKKE